MTSGSVKTAVSTQAQRARKAVAFTLGAAVAVLSLGGSPAFAQNTPFHPGECVPGGYWYIWSEDSPTMMACPPVRDSSGRGAALFEGEPSEPRPAVRAYGSDEAEQRRPFFGIEER